MESENSPGNWLWGLAMNGVERPPGWPALSQTPLRAQGGSWKGAKTPSPFHLFAQEGRGAKGSGSQGGQCWVAGGAGGAKPQGAKKEGSQGCSSPWRWPGGPSLCFPCGVQGVALRIRVSMDPWGHGGELLCSELGWKPADHTWPCPCGLAPSSPSPCCDSLGWSAGEALPLGALPVCSGPRRRLGPTGQGTREPW